MQLTKSKEWLEELLSGNEPTAEDLRRLVSECPTEDLNLDYKSGREFDDKAKAAETLREYAAAFANSDGGALVIGYHLQGQVFDGAKVPGGGRFEDWVARVLYSMRSFLNTSPRAYEVEGVAPTGAVLVVAVSRSDSLVPVDVKGSGPVYFLRIGDSNYPPKGGRNAAAPPYLASDLLVGRRSHPLLVATRATYDIESLRNPEAMPVARLRCQVLIENVGLSMGEDLRVGAVALAPYAQALKIIREPTRSLLGYVSFPEPDPVHSDPYFGHHHASSQRRDFIVNLRPFEQQQFSFELFVPRETLFAVPPPGASADDRTDRGRGLLFAALYILAKDMPPRWYQIVVAYKPAVAPPRILWSRIGAPEGLRPEVTWRSLPKHWETDPLEQPAIEKGTGQPEKPSQPPR